MKLNLVHPSIQGRQKLDTFNGHSKPGKEVTGRERKRKRKAQSERRARVLVEQNAAVHQVIWKSRKQKAVVETMAEKTEEELKREIEELRLKEIEISERLRDPRGLRRGPRNFGPAARQRGFTRPADPIDSEDQPAPKRRLSSAVVKVIEAADGAQEGATSTTPMVPDTAADRHFGNSRPHKRDSGLKTEDHGPKKKPQDTDPTLVTRNRRMLGSLLGTLQKFQKEDRQLSSTEAYMRRSNSLQRAEQKAREESEKLRQQEREKIAENRRRDLTLRARLAAKAEEKRLELLFLRWSEHHKRLGNYLRTKAEPSIYYLPKKPLDEDETVAEQRKEKAYLEWKLARREELSEYQKQIGEQYLANVETELERWQNSRNIRRGNNNLMNLQETMDKELETHQLEHGPKTRKIPGGAENNDDEDDVEDINVGEDDILDDELVVDDRSRSVDVTFKSEESNVILSLDDI